MALGNPLAFPSNCGIALWWLKSDFVLNREQPCGDIVCLLPIWEV